MCWGPARSRPPASPGWASALHSSLTRMLVPASSRQAADVAEQLRSLR